MACVCILTAGKGSRLNERTRYFNKALLRVGDKAAISHQIEMFPATTTFVVGLGYMGSIVRQYLEIAHPDTHFIFVDIDKYSVPGSGPGYALMQCAEHLQRPFYFLACDTLIDNSEQDLTPSGNWIGVAQISPGTEQNYCCVEHDGVNVTSVYDKDNNYSVAQPVAFIGLAFIKNANLFWRHMQDNHNLIGGEIQLSPALFALEQTVRRFTWYDIGNEEGLLKARASFDGLQNLDKPDEEIYICDDKVIKYFHDTNVVRNRLIRASLLNGLVPGIQEHSANFYSYNFVQGKDLFHVARPQDHIERLLDYTKDTLWKPIEIPDPVEFCQACYRFYHDKTTERLNRFYAQTRIEDKEEIINNITTRATLRYLEQVNWDDIAETAIPGLFHGDFQPANIVMAPDGHFTFIDWRQDFGGLTAYGDICYDFAKMNVCFLMPHDSLRNGLYSYSERKGEILVDIQVSRAITECQRLFYKWLENNLFPVRKTKLLAYIAMLNMACLHEHPLDKWLYYTAKHGLAQIFRGI